MITASRYHDFSAGHRVMGHENKCADLHGHNYRVTFDVGGMQDDIGRVLDFGVIKSHLCDWLEQHWDHKFLLWSQDPLWEAVGSDSDLVRWQLNAATVALFRRSFVSVPFNPTAENMADYLLRAVGPAQLAGTGATLWRVVVEETRKCWASAEIPPEEW